MLELKVYDRGNEIVLTFEHSLLSVSKWEAKTKKSWFASASKSAEELIDYFGDMLTTPEHDSTLVYRLSPDQLKQLTTYLSDSQSAASPPEDSDGKRTGERYTSDKIYAQMVVLKIPFEAQRWHLNRLMMLIAHVAYMQKPEDKKKKGNLWGTWQDLNARNRKFFNSNG